MAVVQISKIQVRRGLKNSGIGVPQLSSAEFAWAVDTQELFIGNGSVAEGAPYVGNTKILTEHDNILELASSYRFGQADNSIIFSVNRSLQSKVDEIEVSVVDYGAIGNGTFDSTESFQNALDELFRNTDDKFKKVLKVPNGIYLIEGNLKIPSAAIIRGETQSNTILDIGNNNILFVGSNGEEVADFTSTNRPKDVRISNLTIHHAQGQTVLTGLADSVFEYVKFRSDYSLGDTVLNISESNSSLYWENTLDGTKVTGIVLKSCTFENTPLAIRSDQIIINPSSPPLFDTFIEISDCYFFECDTGILINGIESQGNKWRILDSRFEEIAARVFVSNFGRGTIIDRCKFINCGNNTNTAASPETDFISFGEKFGNLVNNCSSNRFQAAAFTSVDTVSSVSEVSNASRVTLIDQNYQDISLSDSFKPLAVFSAYNKYTYIDYTLRLGSQTRSGQLLITIDELLNNVTITDRYSYSSPTVSSPGGILMTNFEFTAELKNNTIEAGAETVLLSYRNPLSTGDIGNITFTITYGV
jgi:hypothetical protein